MAGSDHAPPLPWPEGPRAKGATWKGRWPDVIATQEVGHGKGRGKAGYHGNPRLQFGGEYAHEHFAPVKCKSDGRLTAARGSVKLEPLRCVDRVWLKDHALD